MSCRGKIETIQFNNCIWSKILSSIFIFIVSITAVSAQYADTAVYYVKGSLTGIYNKTNTAESFLANNSLRFSVSKKNMLFNSLGSWAYGKQTAGLTNDDYNVSTDFNLYNKKQIFFAWGYSAYDKSYSLKINSRLQIGAGIGYDVLKSSLMSISLSDGFVYEYNDYFPNADVSFRDSETLRNSFRAKYTLYVNKIITIRGNNIWQQSLKKENDYILKFTNSLDFKIKKWLSITIATTYNKINSTSRENFLLTYGLTFDKSF
ncbi:DUF481 domain-containing protein [uncultured Cytophaga sp.]|uniref:DUF481 domain-containing protein n=1 Tax=uncultured Cytophaga sp. TaxID=160238 RepID=UPI0026116480|nr:DUF481 domain-containing protein [uncultured Cytophaga sp.]